MTVTGAVGHNVGIELFSDMVGVKDGIVELPYHGVGVTVELRDGDGILMDAIVNPVPVGTVELPNGGSVALGVGNVVVVVIVTMMMESLLVDELGSGNRLRSISEFEKVSVVEIFKLFVGVPLGGLVMEELEGTVKLAVDELGSGKRLRLTSVLLNVSVVEPLRLGVGLPLGGLVIEEFAKGVIIPLSPVEVKVPVLSWIVKIPVPPVDVALARSDTVLAGGMIPESPVLK